MNIATNLDPLNPFGRPSQHSLVATNFQRARVVPRMHPDCIAYVNGLALAGIKLWYVLDAQSLGTNPQAWEARMVEIVNTFPEAEVYVLGNEPDANIGVYPTKKERQAHSPSSWVMDLEEWVNFHQQLAPILMGRGYRVGMAASCGGHPEMLTWVYAACQYDVAAIHPYAKGPEEARAMLRDYKNIVWPNAQIYVTEWNRPRAEVIPFARMLDEEGIPSAWFCHSNGMVSGFGLYNEDGSLTGEGKKILTYNGGSEQPMAEFVLGFKRFHDMMPGIVGEPKVRPEFNTGFPGWQVQTTTNGILSWHEGNGMIFVSNDERVWRWADGDPAPMEIPR